MVVGLPVRLHHRTYNTAAVLRDGQILGFAAKQFLANDGVHYETRFFVPWPAGETTTVEYEGESWPLGDLTFEHLGVRFGFEICEDAWRADDVRPACRLHAARWIDYQPLSQPLCDEQNGRALQAGAQCFAQV